MKSSRKTRFYSSTSTASAAGTTTVTVENGNSTEIPIKVRFPNRESAAAIKIQSSYRSHLIRSLVSKIKSVNSESDRLQRLIQRQETVDAVRTNDRERIRMNEALMKLLFTLDSVPGVDPTVRELRRRVSRRIVGLQEILDSVCEARVGSWDVFLGEWDDVVAGIEEEVCREKGGRDSRELTRFCAENLGFQCLQRFLRE